MPTWIRIGMIALAASGAAGSSALGCSGDEAKETAKDVIAGGVEVVGKGISGGAKALASAPEPDPKALARLEKVGHVTVLSWKRDGTRVEVELGIDNADAAAPLDASVLAARDVLLLVDAEGFTYALSLESTRGVMGVTIDVPAGGKVRKGFVYEDVPEKAKPATLRGPKGTIKLPEPEAK